MSRALSFTKTQAKDVFIARAGAAQARVIAYVVNGRAVIGFDEPTPSPSVEAKIVSKNDHALARLIQSAH